MADAGGDSTSGDRLSRRDRDQLTETMEEFLSQAPSSRCRGSFRMEPTDERGELTVIYNDQQEFLLEYTVATARLSDLPERLSVDAEKRPVRFTEDPLYGFGEQSSAHAEFECDLFDVVANIYGHESADEIDEDLLLWPNRTNGVGLFAVSLTRHKLIFASGFRVPDSLVDKYHEGNGTSTGHRSRNGI